MKRVLLFIFLINCFTILTLSAQTIKDVQIDYEKEKQELYLAATKLCWDFNYKEVFRSRRIRSTEYSNHCTAFIPYPYIFPLEYFHHLYKRDNRIKLNRTNAFKLKEIRQELYNKHYESFKKKALNIDTENMVSYTIVRSKIQDYDFDTKQLRISFSAGGSKKIGSNSQGIKIPKLSNRNQVFYAHYINMKEEDAKAIYEYYETSNINKNPPFYLSTKTTYKIDAPNQQKRPFSFECIIKKIEFYIKEGDNIIDAKKIGEVLFEQTIYYNKYKWKYQKRIQL